MSERRRNLYLRVGLAITGVITLLAVLGCFWMQSALMTVSSSATMRIDGQFV